MVVVLAASGLWVRADDFADDFEAAFVPARSVGQGPAAVTGELPESWLDDSHWAKVGVRYERHVAEPFAGESSLRMTVERVDEGQVQLVRRNVGLSRDRWIDLNMAVRSPTGSTVQLMLRQQSKPYRSYWESVVQAGAEWQTVQRTIPVYVEDADVQFAIVVDRPGVVDLDAVRLTYVAPAKQEQSTRLGSGNLLPHSSFPDGVPPPWLTRNLRIAKTDPAELGPTGVAALRIEADTAQVDAPFTACLLMAFRTEPDQPHTVSLHARTDQPGTEMVLRIGVPGQPIWREPFSRTVSLQNTWTQHRHTVTLPRSDSGHYVFQLGLSGRGAAWIDGLQVILGEQPADSPRTGPVELTLQPVEHMGLSVDEQPMTVRVTAVGEIPEGARLQSRLTHADGAAVERAALQWPREQTAHAITLNDKLAARYGTVRLEARLVNEEGQPWSRWSEALLHRVREPRYADRRCPDSPFGAHWTTNNLRDEDMRVVNRLGVKWLRLFKTVPWHIIERRPGEYDWTLADQDVALLEKHYIMGLGVVGAGAPQWLSDNPHGYRGWARFAPTQIEPWQAYCNAVVQRYRGRLDHFEAWNEPYWPHFFTRTVTADDQRLIESAQRYVQLQKALWEAARKHNPDALIGWNTNALGAAERTKETIDAGVLDYCNLVTIHQYHASPDVQAVLDRHAIAMRRAMGDRADTLPIWNTEGGQGPSQTFNFYAHVPPQNEPTHAVFWADWLCSYYLGTLQSGVDKFFVYLFAPAVWWSKDYTISNVDGRLGPNATALSNLFWQLEGTRIVERRALSGQVKATLFAGDCRHVAVLEYAAPPRASDIPTGQGIEVYDLFGNPVIEARAIAGTLVFIQARDVEKLDAALASAQP